MRYSKETKDFIKSFVYGHSHKEITEAVNDKFGLNLSPSQIKGFIKNNKLNTGRTGRFEAGRVSLNKGKKIGSRGRSKETQFKKGQVPHNYLKVGTEVINSIGYWQVKIAEDKWQLKHRLEYEKHHGPIPKGHVVIFADRNRNNFSKDNLILITNEQLLTMNQNNLIKEDIELTKTGVVIADLIIKVVETKNNMKQQD